MKNLDLTLKIQQEYFDINKSFFKDHRDNVFGNEENLVKAYNQDPKHYPSDFSMLFIDKEECKDYLNTMNDFWNKNAINLIDSLNTKNYLGICLYELLENTHRIFPRLSLYFDTIFIPDTNSWNTMYLQMDSDHLMIGVKAFHWNGYVNSFYPWMKCNSNYPVVVFFPEGFLRDKRIETKKQEIIYNKADLYSIEFFKELFGIHDTINSWEELIDRILLSGISRVNKNLKVGIAKKISNQPMYKLKASGMTNVDIIKFSKSLKNLSQKNLKSTDIRNLYDYVFGLFGAIEEIEKNCVDLCADHTVEPITWPVSNWRYKHIAEEYRSLARISNEQLIAHSFTKRFHWLCPSIGEAIRIREEGDLEEFRSLLRLERSKLRYSTIDDFPQSIKDFEYKILKLASIENERFRKQKRKKKIKRVLSFSSFGLSAVFGVASIAFPNLLVVSAASALFGVGLGTSVKDLINDHLTEKKKIRTLARRPIAFMAKFGGRIK
ncbi:hypothetical protein ACFL36_01355 [Thermodesulfobacteriota bacterium]